MDLTSGDRFTATVDYISRSGTATVDYQETQINIGKVTCDTGRRVRLKYLGETEEFGNEVHFAICLTDEILHEDYRDNIRSYIDDLSPERPPKPDEEIYVEIEEIRERNLATAAPGGTRIELGPVREEVGELIRVIGVNENYAKVRRPEQQGNNYEVRFNILTGRQDELPVSVGDEITTTISDADDEVFIGYVGDVPVHFVDPEAEMAQKIDAQITEFSEDRVYGEILETYDEVGRIEHNSHWARMQLLREAGLGKEPLRTFAQEFLDTTETNLPDKETRLRDALIAEAIRLGVNDKVDASEDVYPRVHISGLRHWVEHKLAAILGKPDDQENADWFREILLERKGPTITFIGDILQLSEGYYASAPTRAVMTDDSEAVLVSGRPSSEFHEAGLEIEFRGITRIITDTSKEDLEGQNIAIQSQEEYVGIGNTRLLTEQDFARIIETQSAEDWDPEADWMVYAGQNVGFIDDEDPLVVQMDDDRRVTFWKVPVEYGTDAYRIKIEEPGNATAAMSDIQPRYRKQVELILDSLSGLPQEVELSSYSGGVLVNCDFVPPRPQMRWLYAIGAEWTDTPTQTLQWRITEQGATSVKEVFKPMPVNIIDNTTEGA